MALEIETTDQDGNQLIAARGEVDLYASPVLRNALLKAIPQAKGALWVDLSEVDYMDSSGVATLVEGLKSATQKKLGFVLVAPSQSVMKVLQLSKLDSVFTIKDSL
jgi:anti-sigma B factor antagonist